MNDSLDHLSSKKQKELRYIVHALQTAAKGQIDVDMVLLFGSYARGDFVEEDIVKEWHTTLEYKSDFDLLVVTRKPTQEKNMRFSVEMNDALNADDTLSSPVSILVEDIYHINTRLAENRYFYLDIKKEGIVLYDSHKCELGEVRALSEEEQWALQQDDFETWFKGGQEFFLGHKDFLKRNYLSGAAFMLHQSTEKFITAYMLVKTSYKPKTHDLQVLYDKLKKLEPAFEDWFDLSDGKDAHHFTLLRKAYIDARYSKNYLIRRDELDYLAEKVMTLKVIVERLCKEVIKA